MGDNKEVFTSIQKKQGVGYPVLTPNLKGLEGAVASGAQEVALFTAATESFNRKNTNCSTEESLKRAREITKKALDQNLKVRGYEELIYWFWLLSSYHLSIGICPVFWAVHMKGLLTQRLWLPWLRNSMKQAAMKLVWAIQLV